MIDMKAVVIHAAGAPEVLKIERRSVPNPRIGEVLIRVKAFGLNRSEMFTRQGHTRNVVFPRILGIDAAGGVENGIYRIRAFASNFCLSRFQGCERPLHRTGRDTKNTSVGLAKLDN
jgi:hypothetical protein